jgi:hypothetical protein
MDYLTIILSGSSAGVVALFIAGYIFRRCKKSECNSHISNTSAHFDISIGTQQPNNDVKPTEQRTNSSHTATPIEPKAPEIV